MFKNKLVNIMIIILLSLTLVGTAAVIIIMKMSGDEGPKDPNIDEIVDASVDVTDITTNLLDDSFIRISFKIQTDSSDAKDELAKRDFQVRDIIIKELSNMKSAQFQGSRGVVQLEDRIKAKVNELMQDGRVVKVYTTSKMLQ
ncbi:flagellar basal body-associated protein FliL [Priestia koreensis]|uniref:Flagellar protein FliL n=1 Tax=Priestia koreensis TaxID=284581 RepID=A0A0M0L6A5_9BACI|nr:flagellar basal body-associated protein FliL [Priestia koreensis]KOO46605.1 flagellar basal body-associated protein FliL [Priestia koreensis]MCM3003765.1 flagellar basal body-associated protein FliL [Priestia koreensis]UNL83874.1 flagellar basal body-associated protein FliL [Priestia koreensis]